MIIKAFGIEVEICKGTRQTMIIDGKPETVVFVRREECHEAHKSLQKYLDDRFNNVNQTILSGLGAVNNRIDDVLNSVNNYVQLLKK